MISSNHTLLVLLWCLVAIFTTSVSAQSLIEQALMRAGENAMQLRTALDQISEAERTGMEFLIAYMPQQDLQTLTADFLLEHVTYAYKAWHQSPWKEQISEDLFLNNILPYANVTEIREDWRKNFYDQFQGLIKEAKTPGKAAVKLNHQIFKQTGVKYSRKRSRPDQAPSETIQTGVASCTGLSVMLIDVCRSVGIPARLVGTPLWSNMSGNHSWVEIWDNGWNFTGACEPTGDDLNQGWFIGRAAQADRDSRLHAIYAVSYKPTNLVFPLAWSEDTDQVWAVNVTDRYTRLKEDLPDEVVRVMFETTDQNGERLSAKLMVKDISNRTIFQGKTNDERFDANDHVSTKVELNQIYRVEVKHGTESQVSKIEIKAENQLFSFQLSELEEPSDTSPGQNRSK
ncbi:MAG: transglutaminase-like domain-containing protein [Candidatus Poribacteria bacterium]|nr:transglutaminase-like domain-containing protein [Candidatus Poribacteria bacterium]MDP6746550.1 transglutaminase-like domain-containing protein [Candidatus Poribacteria bacterium]MDP6996986.1 transglutaminase-like domain-containing protein [Candidatus Poribacteria bacterium]